MSRKSPSPLETALRIKEKQKREEASREVKLAVHDSSLPRRPGTTNYAENDVKAAFKQIHSKYMRQMILNENMRSDGRKSNEIRPIDIEQGTLASRPRQLSVYPRRNASHRRLHPRRRKHGPAL